MSTGITIGCLIVLDYMSFQYRLMFVMMINAELPKVTDDVSYISHVVAGITEPQVQRIHSNLNIHIFIVNVEIMEWITCEAM